MVSGEGDRVRPVDLTPAGFVEKWRGVTTTEKASSQSHFIDLCRLGEPTLHEADPTGEHDAFEKRVTKGGRGWLRRRLETRLLRLGVQGQAGRS